MSSVFSINDNKVYCNLCCYYAVSNSIIKKGGKFNVNIASCVLSSVSLKYRGNRKYNMEDTSKEFFASHNSPNPKF